MRPNRLCDDSSSSWMERTCKVFGSYPFMYTCSNRLNILIQRCGWTNHFSAANEDYLRNYPGPATNESGNNVDLIVYHCQDYLEDSPNPYRHANALAHEVAHVIQTGFGQRWITMAEGGATWLEGPLLGLPPRPMQYLFGFDDWNRINAA